MNRLWSLIVILLVPAAPLLFAEAPTSVPEDPQAILVEMTYLQPGLDSDPEVVVFASGRVRVKVGEGAIWGQLSEEQLTLLYRSLCQEDGLTGITTDSLQQALSAESGRTGLSWRIINADETRITLKTASGTHEILAHAVGLLSVRFPQVEPLQKVSSAQRRLENLRAVMMAGGPDAASKLAEMANRELHSEYGDRVNIGPENLTMVRTLADGTRCCQFVIRDGSPASAREQIISLVESPGEVPRVTLFGDGPIFR